MTDEKTLMNYFNKYTMLILSLIGLLGFNFLKHNDMTADLSNEDKVMYSFIGREGRVIGKKYKMHLGSAGGGINDGIWLMSLTFQRYGSYLTEEEARKLIINCLHDYLQAVNEDEKLKPSLKVYPFTPKNINMRVFNYDPVTRDDVFHPYISLVKASENKIIYYTDNEFNQFKYESEKYETYEKAVAILKEHTQSKARGLN